MLSMKGEIFGLEENVITILSQAIRVPARHRGQKKAYDKSLLLAISVNFRFLPIYSLFSGLKPTRAFHMVLESYLQSIKLTFADNPWSRIAP